MGTEKFYKPGSFYRIDDRTGFAFRAERTKMEWQGLIVSDRVWEARQPQDFVKGVDDNQTVPYARPRQPNPALGTYTLQYEEYAGKSFYLQGGQIHLYNTFSGVNPANFPSGF